MLIHKYWKAECLLQEEILKDFNSQGETEHNII